jgi:hypothetical protein
VLYRSEYNPYFKTNPRLFPALEFLAQLLQHLPHPRSQLVRRYGLFSSRSRGSLPPVVKPVLQDSGEPSASTRESRSAWARLLAKVYQGDALHCSRCGSPMTVLAVITNPPEIRRILLHLIKTGLAPPGLEASALN